jgi:hypothetical protein
MSDEITLGYLQEQLSAAEALASNGSYAKALQRIEPLIVDEMLPRVRDIDRELVDILKDRANRYRVEGNKAGEQALTEFKQHLSVPFKFEPSDMLKQGYKEDGFVERWVKAAEAAFKPKHDALNAALDRYVAAVSETEDSGQARYSLSLVVKSQQKVWSDAAVIFQVRQKLQDLANSTAILQTLVAEYGELDKVLRSYIAESGTTPDLETLSLEVDSIRQTKGAEAYIYTSAIQGGNYAQELKRLEGYADDYLIDKYDDAGNYTGKIKVIDARQDLLAKAETWANEEKAPEYLQAAEQAIAAHRPREALLRVVDDRSKIERFLERDFKELFDARRQEANAQLGQLREAEAAAQKSREFLAKRNFREAWTQYGVAFKTFEWLEDLNDLKSDIIAQSVEGIAVLEGQARTAYENSKPRSNGVTQVGKLLRDAQNLYGKIDDDGAIVKDRLGEFESFYQETTKHGERVAAARKDLKEAENLFKNGKAEEANRKLEALRIAYKAEVLDDLGADLDTLTTKVDAAVNIGKLEKDLKDLLRVNALDDIRSKLDAAKALKNPALASVIKELELHQRFIEAKGKLAIGQVDEALTEFNEIAKQTNHVDRTEAAGLADKIRQQRSNDDKVRTDLTTLKGQIGNDPAKVFRDAIVLNPIDIEVNRFKTEVVEAARAEWVARVESDLSEQDSANRADDAHTRPNLKLALVKRHLDDLQGDLNLKQRHDYWWSILGARFEAAQARSQEAGGAWDDAVSAWERAIGLASPDVVPALNQALLEAKIKQMVGRTEGAGSAFGQNTSELPAILSALIGDLKALMEKSPSEPLLKLCLARACIWAAFHVEKLDKTRADLSNDVSDLRSQLFSTAFTFANEVQQPFKGKPEEDSAKKALQHARIGKEISEPMGRIYSAITTRNSVKMVGDAVNQWKQVVERKSKEFPQLVTWWENLVQPAKASLMQQHKPDGDIQQDKLAELGMLVVLENDIRSDILPYTRLLKRGLSRLQLDFQAEKERLENRFRTASGTAAGYNASEPLVILKTQIGEMQAAIRKFDAVAQLVDHFEGEASFNNYRQSFSDLGNEMRHKVDELLELEEAIGGIIRDFSPDMLDVNPLLERISELEGLWRSGETKHRALQQLRKNIAGRGEIVQAASNTMGRVRTLLQIEDYVQLDLELTNDAVALMGKGKNETYPDPTNPSTPIISIDTLRNVVKERANEHRRLVQYLAEVGADGILNRSPILRGKSSKQTSVTTPLNLEETAANGGQPQVRRPIPWDSGLAKDEKKRIQKFLDAGQFDRVCDETNAVIAGYEYDPAYRSLNETIEMLENPGRELGFDSVSDDPSIEVRYKHAKEQAKSGLTKQTLDMLQTEHLKTMQDKRADAETMCVRAIKNKGNLDTAWDAWKRANQEIAKVFEAAGGFNANIRGKSAESMNKHLADADRARRAAQEAAPEHRAVQDEMNRLWIYRHAKLKVGVGQ